MQIHVWMLKEDKMNTTQSIAYSSKLFNDDTDIFKIPKCENDELLKKNLEEINSSMNEIDENEDKDESKLNKVKKNMKFTSTFKKMESAPVESNTKMIFKSN